VHKLRLRASKGILCRYILKKKNPLMLLRSAVFVAYTPRKGRRVRRLFFFYYYHCLSNKYFYIREYLSKSVRIDIFEGCLLCKRLRNNHRRLLYLKYINALELQQAYSIDSLIYESIDYYISLGVPVTTPYELAINKFKNLKKISKKTTRPTLNYLKYTTNASCTVNPLW